MHLAFALPDPADTGRGGGTDYADNLVPALRSLGHVVDVLAGPRAAFPPGATPVVDGFLIPSLHDDPAQLGDAVGLVHHVAAAAGRDDGARQLVQEREACLLPRLRRVIATSHPVADRLAADYGIHASVVEPGARHLPRSRPHDPEPLILAVGVLTRRKGHDSLLRVLSRLTDLPWRLVIAGASAREPAHAAELAALIDELGLASRAELHPDPTAEALERSWQQASVFALASRWEGYPTAIAEALRRGIPTVVSDVGRAGELVPAMAGTVVPLDDMPTLGKCLRRVLFDDALRTDMADAAWSAGTALVDWPTRAQHFIEAIGG